LEQIGVTFAQAPQEIDETPAAGESAEALAERLALKKARAAYAVQEQSGCIVLGSDTVVVAGDAILGKPEHADDALRMLALLSNRRHRVCTAVSLVSGNRSASRLSVTEVSFREIKLKEAQAYWETGEPHGKAGAYAIQGLGAVFIAQISGSYSGVMGLPLYETAQLLAEFGIPILPPSTASQRACTR
jgi:septum formation protein